MNYEALTKDKLVIILGERDEKITQLLKELEDEFSEITTLKTDAAAHAASIETLNNELTQKKNFIIELGDIVKKKDTEIAGLNSEITDHKENLEEADEVIIDLKNQLGQANQLVESSTNVVNVSYKGKTYQAVLPRFMHNSEVYEAKDLKTNPALVAELIEDELGVLKLVK